MLVLAKVRANIRFEETIKNRIQSHIDRGTHASICMWRWKISIEFLQLNIVSRRIIHSLFTRSFAKIQMAMMDVSMHKTNQSKSNTIAVAQQRSNHKQLPIITWSKPKWYGILIHFLISLVVGLTWQSVGRSVGRSIDRSSNSSSVYTVH